MLCHLSGILDVSSMTKTDLKKLPRTSAHSVDPSVSDPSSFSRGPKG